MEIYLHNILYSLIDQCGSVDKLSLIIFAVSYRRSIHHELSKEKFLTAREW